MHVQVAHAHVQAYVQMPPYWARQQHVCSYVHVYVHVLQAMHQQKSMQLEKSKVMRVCVCVLLHLCMHGAMWLQKYKLMSMFVRPCVCMLVCEHSIEAMYMQQYVARSIYMCMQTCNDAHM